MPNRSCNTPGCTVKNAKFNLKGKSPGIKCAKHGRPLGMVNIYSRICAYGPCPQPNPSFNEKGCKSGIYCQKHKIEGMVNVVTRTCQQCGDVPSFNMPGTKSGIRCAGHKSEGMVDVVHNKCNYKIGNKICGIVSYFNLDGEKKVSDVWNIKVTIW